MRSDFPTKHSPIGRGYISYHQAKIRTLLGHKKEAVELLKRSRKEGRCFVGNFRLDGDLVNLKGFEPFEELIRPKSSIKD